MNYIGSKFSLLDFLENTITDCIGKELNHLTFCDAFAGTGTVGSYFKNKTAKVIANDCEYYSFVLNQNLLNNNFDISELDELVSELNQLSEKKDKQQYKIYQHYALGSGSERQYFSDENAIKIDTIRTEIEDLRHEVGENKYFCLLAGLLESADKVANTASVYGAFLKKLKKSAEKPLILKLTEFSPNKNQNEVYHQDTNELIKKISGDILYLDPPYNHREYGANYHILNTIAYYDDFTPKGKTGLRQYNKSLWCKKNTAAMAFEDLIKNAEFKYIFLSYNNEGIISPEEIKNICQKYGKYDIFTKQYRRFKADNARNHKANQTVEYLHFIEKP
ncbi:MAG: DNA adenine methylase [Neisseriaceae bacterium]|nr:DNA adenine methylase [Neisseriaceae bacterium]